jgi:DNA (cytosine-5)-methyltransferase 1
VPDLFAGPGGIDHAARQLGIRLTGIEQDANAVATRRSALLDTVRGDVRDFRPVDFDEDTLTAGPPCQSFTLTGNGEGRAALGTLLAAVKAAGARGFVTTPEGLDDRTGLVLEPLRWILEAHNSRHPYRAIVLEQVPAVLPIWQAYAEVLEALGYSVACGVLNAEEYGVPQTRRRAALVARLDGPVALPAPTHRRYTRGVPQSAGDPALLPWVSMGDVLSERGPFTVVSNYGTGGDPKNRGRRDSTVPAFTVTGKISRFRLLDPDGRELDRFTNSEAGRLQGFPADYPWSGADISQQIGNAAPVQLAHALLTAAAA